MTETQRQRADRLAAELDEARRRIALLEAAAAGTPLGGGLAQRMLDGFSLLDEHGVHLEVNEALCAMTGFTRDELVGAAPPHPYWPPEEMDAVRDVFRRTMAGDTATFPLTFMRKSGERFPALVTPSVLTDEHGAVTGAFATVKDMSELHRALSARAESEKLFRLAFDQSPVGAVLAGPDFRFLRVNDAFCRLTGYTADELLTLGFPDVTHPDDVDTDVAAARRIMTRGTPEYHREKRYVRKDGSVVWGEVTARPVRGDDGQVLTTLAIIVDVTERRLAEQEAALRAREASDERDRVRHIVDSIPDEVWFTDADGRFTLANPAAVLEFGEDAAPGTAVADLAARLEVLRPDGTPRPPEEAPPLRALRGETVRNLEEVVRTPTTGELRHRLVSSTPLRGADGGVTGCVSVVRDVTELHEAQAALRESEERYRSVVEAAHEGILLQARDGTILAWNRAAQQILGPSEDEVVGVDARAREWHLMHEDGSPWPADDHPTMRTFATGEPCEGVLLGLWRGDELRWVEATTRPLTADGETLPYAVIATFADVTERRLAEEEAERQRRRAQTYLDVAQVMLVALDAQGTVTLANRKACEVLGQDESGLVGHDWFESAVPPEIRAPLRELFFALMHDESDAFLHLENPVLTAAGEERLVAWHNSVLRDEEGVAVGTLRSGEDITERRRAEQELCDSEERYRLLVHNASDAVLVHEVGPEGPGRFVEVNDRACAMLGFTRQELLQLDVGAIDTPEQTSRSAAISRDLLTRGHALFETEHVRKDGTLVPVEISVSVLDLRGRRLALSVVRDVTERREAQRALLESEQKYREVVERASDGVLILDADAVLFANAAFARLSGFTVAELEGLPFGDLLQEQDRALITTRVRRRIGGGDEPATYEIDLVAKDGSLFAVEVGAGLTEYRGRTADLIVARDISERRRAQEAVRALEAMRDTTERVSHVGSWRYDLATSKVSWSPETFRLYDVDEADWDGEFAPVLQTRVHPDDRAAVAADVTRYEHVDVPDPLEYRVVHRDASVHVLHAEGRLERDVAGKPVAVVGFCQDVTEQRLADAAVRAAEARYRSLFEESPVAIWELDMAEVIAWVAGLDKRERLTLGGRLDDPDAVAEVARHVHVTHVNRASLEMFAAAREEDITQDFLGCFTAETLTAFAAAVHAYEADAKSFAVRSEFARRDGTRCTLDVSLAIVDGGSGRRDRVLASFIDVTEQERAEAEVNRLNAELRRRVVSRTEQLDAATHELEALAYSMAHDVRAPLRTIDGFSAIVLEDEAANLAPASVDSLRRVRAAAQTLARLLDDLTGLSQVSRRPLQREPADLSAIATQVAIEMTAEHPARLVDVQITPGLVADADAHLVRLVFHELLDNAWKFTAPRRLAHVQVGETARDGQTAYYVRDDGVGFDLDYAGHLFGAFQRMHPPGEFPGDGIGLAMVQRLVRRHGGRVWAESEVGHGATFFFTLPAPHTED